MTQRLKNVDAAAPHPVSILTRGEGKMLKDDAEKSSAQCRRAERKKGAFAT